MVRVIQKNSMPFLPCKCWAHSMRDGSSNGSQHAKELFSNPTGNRNCNKTDKNFSTRRKWFFSHFRLDRRRQELRWSLLDTHWSKLLQQNSSALNLKLHWIVLKCIRMCLNAQNFTYLYSVALNCARAQMYWIPLYCIHLRSFVFNCTQLHSTTLNCFQCTHLWSRLKTCSTELFAFYALATFASFFS